MMCTGTAGQFACTGPLPRSVTTPFTSIHACVATSAPLSTKIAIESKAAFAGSVTGSKIDDPPRVTCSCRDDCTIDTKLLASAHAMIWSASYCDDEPSG